MKKTLLLNLIIGLLNSLYSSAQVNVIDTTFKAPHFFGMTSINQFEVLPDKTILVAGQFDTTSAGATDWDFTGLLKLDSNGSIVKSFTYSYGQGKPNFHHFATQPDGKIILSGATFTTNSATPTVQRLLPDLSVDPTFTNGSCGYGPSQTNDGYPQLVVRSPDGSLFVGGEFTYYNGLPFKRLVKLNSDGKLDTNFKYQPLEVPNPGGPSGCSINGIWPLPNGKILLDAWYYSRRWFTMLKPDGSQDTSFVGKRISTNGDMKSECKVLPDGRFLIGRPDLLEINGFKTKYLARFHADARLDSSFHIDLPVDSLEFMEYISDIKVQKDGKIVMAGWFYPGGLNMTGQVSAYRFHQDGSSDPSFAFHADIQTGPFEMIDIQPGLGIVFVRSDFSSNQQPQAISRARVADLGEKTNLITGSLFDNLDNNCIKSAAEIPIANTVISAMPGPYWGVTDNAGRYHIYTDTGSYIVKQMPGTQTMPGVQYCPPNNDGISVQFGATTGNILTEKNFVNTLAACPFLKVEISSDRRRFCARNLTTVNIQNLGIADAPIGNTLKLRMPRHVSLISASKTFTWNAADSTYGFDVGAMPPRTSQIIQVVDSVACTTGINGIEQCTKAWITPGNVCVPVSPNWDGVDLSVTATCHNGTPRFRIANSGSAMNSIRQYYIYVDSVLAWTNPFQLGANSALTFNVMQALPSHTVRLEVAQSPYHPTSTFAAQSISCGTGVVTPGGGYFAIPDESPVESTQCLPIRNSFDPNDKSVYPQGATSQGNVLPNRPFKYRIRFQNTGNDVAYRVVVRDTLGAGLDPATFEMGNTSHTYNLQVSGKGRPVLSWYFENINLPDSGSNPAESNGYIDFTIRPYDNLPPGTQIRNFADIYFDHNAPVRTNTTLNTLYIPTVTTGIIDSIDITSTRPFATKADIRIYPNPNHGKFEVTGNSDFAVTVFSLAGKQLLTLPEDKRHSLDLSRFGAGMYLLETKGGNGKCVQKVIVE